MLLSSEKKARFEAKIEREIADEFDREVDVLVKSGGKVYVFAPEGRRYGEASEIMRQEEEEVLEVLSDIDFVYEQSSYEITGGGDDLIGASFYLHRDGW